MLRHRSHPPKLQGGVREQGGGCTGRQVRGRSSVPLGHQHLRLGLHPLPLWKAKIQNNSSLSLSHSDTLEPSDSWFHMWDPPIFFWGFLPQGPKENAAQVDWHPPPACDGLGEHVQRQTRHAIRGGTGTHAQNLTLCHI